MGTDLPPVAQLQCGSQVPVGGGGCAVSVTCEGSVVSEVAGPVVLDGSGSVVSEGSRTVVLEGIGFGGEVGKLGIDGAHDDGVAVGKGGSTGTSVRLGGSGQSLRVLAEVYEVSVRDVSVYEVDIVTVIDDGKRPEQKVVPAISVHETAGPSLVKLELVSMVCGHVGLGEVEIHSSEVELIMVDEAGVVAVIGKGLNEKRASTIRPSWQIVPKETFCQKRLPLSHIPNCVSPLQTSTPSVKQYALRCAHDK